MPSKLVVLLTDFGLKDHYVGVMKGVILDICPEVRFVDLTHEISPQNVREGAFVLGVSYHYFPKGAIFLGVVDPGVGTSRRGLLLKAGEYFFVGPDNGLFTWVVKKEGIYQAFELSNPSYFRPEVSRTFHGRDIFAPVSAYLAKGISPEEFGPRLKEIIMLPWPEVEEGPSYLKGAIIHVDRFGNLISNIAAKQLRRPVKRVLYRGLELPLLETYALVSPGKPLALIGSEGLLEIAVCGGSAAERFGTDGEVWVEFSSS